MTFHLEIFKYVFNYFCVQIVPDLVSESAFSLGPVCLWYAYIIFF